jgi:hypothetical protein
LNLDIDHERLTDKFQGRYCRLTDVHGRVVNEVLACARESKSAAMNQVDFWVSNGMDKVKSAAGSRT